jgi:hypothetical protein
LASHSYEQADIELVVNEEKAKNLAKKKTANKVRPTITIAHSLGMVGNEKNCFKLFCGLCCFQTSDAFEMENHLGEDYHFILGSKLFCYFCNYSPASLQDVTDHGKTHEKSFELYKIRCSKCNFLTTDLGRMQDHATANHFKTIKN